jgi:hypothetical protein
LPLHCTLIFLFVLARERKGKYHRFKVEKKFLIKFFSGTNLSPANSEGNLYFYLNIDKFGSR